MLNVGKFERFAMPHAAQSVQRVDLSYFVGKFVLFWSYRRDIL